MKKSLFYWYILLCVNAFVGFWLYYFGMFQWAFSVDVTYISTAIAALYTISFFALGVSISRTGAYDMDIQDRFDIYYHMGAQMVGLGLLGTILGFIYMMTNDINIATLNLEDKKEIVKLMGNIMPALGTALVTTAAGLIASLFLNNQTYYLVRKLRYET